MILHAPLGNMAKELMAQSEIAVMDRSKCIFDQITKRSLPRPAHKMIGIGAWICMEPSVTRQS